MISALMPIFVVILSFFILALTFYFDISQNFIYGIILGILIVALASLRLHSVKSTKPFFIKWRKWWYFLLTCLIVSFVVLATGNIYSPFLVLIHFSILGLGFFFGFWVSILFLLFSIVFLVTSAFFDPALLERVMQDPVTIVLYGVSFLTLLPIAWLLSHYYHSKDKIFNALQSQVKVEESIMQSLQEMIFVTDRQTNVLSLNESAVRILRKGRSELLGRPLFEALFLTRKGGGLVSPEVLGIEKIIEEKEVREFDNLLLVASELPVQGVKLTITPVVDMEGSVEQLSFVIVDKDSYGSIDERKSSAAVEQARIHQEALLEDLKRKLAARGFMELWTQLLIIQKSSEDVALIQTINEHEVEAQKEVVDVSRLCSRIVALEEGYARAFGVQLTFSLVTLGWKVSDSFQNSVVKIEESTDPFFTVRYNVRHLSVLIEKLINLSVLLSSHVVHPKIQFIIGTERSDVVVVWLKVACPEVNDEQLSNLFLQGFGEMSTWKNFQFGSGLEGYIAKTLAGHLGLTLDVRYNKDRQECVFTLQIPRDVQVKSSVAEIKS